MSRRVSLACLVVVIGVSTPAFCAGITDLPENQRQTAQCMVSALDSIPEATHAQINVSTDGAPHIDLTYDFRHRDLHISHQSADISRIVAEPGNPHELVLGGLFSVSDASRFGPEKALDDADAGMPRIVELWRSKCGLRLSGMFV